MTAAVVILVIVLILLITSFSIFLVCSRRKLKFIESQNLEANSGIGLAEISEVPNHP